MKKKLFLSLIASVILCFSVLAMEEGTAVTKEAAKEEIVQTSEFVNLPPEAQFEIIKRLIDDAKDLESIKNVLKTIDSLENTSRQFRNLLGYQDPDTKSFMHKNILSKKLAKQIEKNNIQVSLLIAGEFKSGILEKALINTGADVNMQGKFSVTPLQNAAEKNAKKVVELLLAHKANINAQDMLGRSPLYLAAQGGDKAEEVVKLLLAHKDINVNTPAYNKRTPLHVAITKKAKEVVELLLAHRDIDVNAQDDNNETPLDLAKSVNLPEIEQLLEAAMKKQSARN